MASSLTAATALPGHVPGTVAHAMSATATLRSAAHAIRMAQRRFGGPVRLRVGLYGWSVAPIKAPTCTLHPGLPLLPRGAPRRHEHAGRGLRCCGGDT